MYHRILPANDPRYSLEQPGMIVHPDTFEKHLTWIKDYFSIVDLNDWTKRIANNEPVPNKACAITFDDGWKDNYQYAFPVLKEHNCPATIFLVADYIDTNTTFWPEKLGFVLSRIAKESPDLFSHNTFSWLKMLNCRYRFNSEVPSRDELDEIICAAKIHTDDFLHERVNEIAKLANLELNFNDILAISEISEMHKSELINYGSHTATHTRMSESLSGDILQTELVKSKLNLQSRLNLPITLFCYPNGDITQTASDLVKQTYAAAVTTESGWNSANTNFYNLKRIGLHEDGSNTKNKFLAKLSGLF